MQKMNHTVRFSNVQGIKPQGGSCLVWYRNANEDTMEEKEG